MYFKSYRRTKKNINLLKIMIGILRNDAKDKKSCMKIIRPTITHRIFH